MMREDKATCQAMLDIHTQQDLDVHYNVMDIHVRPEQMTAVFRFKVTPIIWPLTTICYPNPLKQVIRFGLCA